MKLPGTSINLKAKHHHATQKSYKPQINKKDGNIANTAFQDEIILKIGAKLMIINNIDVLQGLQEVLTQNYCLLLQKYEY